MAAEFTDAELEAYLDEVLDAERAAEVEREIRRQPDLMNRLARVMARRDAGVHTLGEIWRSNQIGVPSTEELGSYLLGVLSEEHAAYIRFRVETLKCPITTAKLRDLQRRQAEADADQQADARRQRYMRSTAGRLRK